MVRSNRVNYWTGQEGREFEREFAHWIGTRHAIALSNGTLALDLALQGLGIGAANGGNLTDEVIVTPRTFIASVSCVVNAGVLPVFADINADRGLINVETIGAVMSDRIRAVTPAHLAGWPCDMDAIMEFASVHDFAVIEDCAQAHGARIGNRSVGSIGDIGAWSFCQDKIMTTGAEGGMVTCNAEAMWSKMWSFKYHGKSWDAVYNRNHPPGFRLVHESIGTNWRMLEMQAAIGLIQLRRMQKWTEQRATIAQRLHAVLVQYPAAIRAPLPGNDMTHAFYRLYAYVRPDGLRPGWNRDRIVAAFQTENAPLFHGSCSEVYLEKAFDGLPYRPERRLPIARELGETSLFSALGSSFHSMCSLITRITRLCFVGMGFLPSAPPRIVPHPAKDQFLRWQYRLLGY